MANLSGRIVIPGADDLSAAAGKTRRRLTAIAAINGWSVVLFGGLVFLLSLVWFSLWGVLIGAGAVVSGVMELTGRRCVKQRRPEAGRWLAGSQLLLLGVVLLYAASQLLFFDPKAFLKGLPADYQQALASYMSAAEMQQTISQVVSILYACVIVATLLYQGGLCLYYSLAARKLLLVDALAAEVPPYPPVKTGGTETPKPGRAP